MQEVILCCGCPRFILGTPISFFKSSSNYFMSHVALDYLCLTTEGLRDSFNLLVYYPSAKEIHMTMETSNVFVMQKFEVQETIIASEIFEQCRQSFLENLELYGNMISNTLRSTFGELLEGHIGVELTNTYLLCSKQKFAIHLKCLKMKTLLCGMSPMSRN
ncbi:unnamed protein product [Sphagnum troendelagicum]